MITEQQLNVVIGSTAVTQTVPVSREEEEEHEVVLHAERPVVAKEAVPVERVRLDTETVTEQQTVTDTVRKEQIELDADDTARRA
jgi:stress response protein YsnF